MRPTKDRGIRVESTLTGENVDLSIDPAAMQHIMAVLTDLYSDPEYAVVREYATNAIDAHIEAGVSEPIKVTLPSKLSPFLRISDNGIGLSVDDIRRIYSQYGASTKRGTDEQTGMLGLGCKSALTYASQFTIEARRDGEKIAVAVSRSNDGGGSMQIVSHMQTSDRDGVDIVIPARRENALDEKAQRLFAYWPEGSVLVNGRPPARFDGLEITPSIFLVERDEDRSHAAYYRRQAAAEQKHVIVMGNVPYPLELSDDLASEASLPWNTQLVAYVPIGKVDFTPSREQLHYTPLTKATIKQVIADYRAALPHAIQREVDRAPNHAAALSVVAKWQPWIGTTTQVFHYGNDALPSAYEDTWPDKVDENGDPVPRQVRVTNNYGYGSLGGYNDHAALPVTMWPKLVWVENFNLADVSADQKRKMQKWVEDTHLLAVESYVLCYGKAPDTPFIDKARVVSYPDTIKPIQIKARASTRYGATKIPGSYNAWTEADPESYSATETKGDDIRQNVPLFYAQTSRYHGRRESQRLAAAGFDKFTLVILQANRVAKFLRLFPAATTVHEGIAALGATWETNLTDQQRMALAIHDAGATGLLRWLADADLHDPDLTTAGAASKVPTNKLVRQRQIFEDRTPQAKWTNPLLRYPLLADKSRYYATSWPVPKTSLKHVERYINCTYDQEVT